MLINIFDSSAQTSHSPPLFSGKGFMADRTGKYSLLNRGMRYFNRFFLLKAQSSYLIRIKSRNTETVSDTEPKTPQILPLRLERLKVGSFLRHCLTRGALKELIADEAAMDLLQGTRGCVSDQVVRTNLSVLPPTFQIILPPVHSAPTSSLPVLYVRQRLRFRRFRRGGSPATPREFRRSPT